MKFSLIALPALSVLAAAAPTAVGRSDINERQLPSIDSLITGLTAEVKQVTAHIGQVLAALPAEASAIEKSVATTSINKDISDITTVFHNVNAQIAAADKLNSLGNLPSEVLGQLNGQPVALAKLVLPTLQELDPALQSVLSSVELGQVYTSLQPLLSTELPAFVNGLEPLVSGLKTALSPLLSGVGSLLSPILSGLSL